MLTLSSRTEAVKRLEASDDSIRMEEELDLGTASNSRLAPTDSRPGEDRRTGMGPTAESGLAE